MIPKILSTILLLVAFVSTGAAQGPALATPGVDGPPFVAAGGYYPVGLGYYRGGSSLEPRDMDVKIRDGLVQVTHGVSIHRDASKVERFGGAFAVMSIPSTLRITQRENGRDKQHFEIAPAEPMTFENYKAELRRVELRLAQRVG
ncbi:hypothetical protein [Nocardia abscessus]|uniref:hypothetical protein n=1 Tax=Nocardia abscessus TaxID=120957 RepID=UPI002457CDAE|nr:hypothetical protein [Nocardia abscessus]